MEEISWGQRVLAFRPPSYFLEQNFQQELNFHNLAGKRERHLAIGGLLVAFGLLPAVLSRARFARRLHARLGLVTPQSLGRFRRYWVVVAFVLAAIITPTVHPGPQIAVAVPLLVLYEVGILLVRFAVRGKTKSTAISSA